jgi:DNA-binding NtrC family response regulator
VKKPKPTTILWELISRLANTTLTVRISGESGTGKNSIARLLSSHYPHKNSVFLEFNCKTLNLQSKEPAARPPVPGSVETFLSVLAAPQYHVLYLEHIEYLPEDLQGRLLTLFDNNYQPAPPWVISSTVEPIGQFVTKSDFSDALLKVLDTVHIVLPQLRDKLESIPQMFAWLMNQNESQINELAAIYILSRAKLNIQKERVMEGLMTSSAIDEIGLLDLAIFHEAVSQIADHICSQNADQGG